MTRAKAHRHKLGQHSTRSKAILKTTISVDYEGSAIHHPNQVATRLLKTRLRLLLRSQFPCLRLRSDLPFRTHMAATYHLIPIWQSVHATHRPVHALLNRDVLRQIVNAHFHGPAARSNSQPTNPNNQQATTINHRITLGNVLELNDSSQIPLLETSPTEDVDPTLMP